VYLSCGTLIRSVTPKHNALHRTDAPSHVRASRGTQPGTTQLRAQLADGRVYCGTMLVM